MLLGMLVFLVSATNPSYLGIFLALGVIIFGMGMVLSYVGIKSGRTEEPMQLLYEPGLSHQPLSYMESELEKRKELERSSSGNRAFGFVMLSLGIFVLTISGILGGFLGSWPLMLLGIGLTISGATLRLR